MYLQNYQTSRLFIRPLVEKDIIAWAQFFDHPECIQFLPAQPHMTNQEKAAFWIDKQLNRYKENRFGLMALIEKDSEAFIGQCGLLTQEVDGEPVLEIGYHLFPPYWGKGYATEAANFFKNLGFDNNYSNELVSIIDIGNTASQKVALRNGMTNRKLTQYWGLDVFIYSITKPY